MYDEIHRYDGIEQALEVGTGLTARVGGHIRGQMAAGREAEDAHRVGPYAPLRRMAPYQRHGLLGIAHGLRRVAGGHGVAQHYGRAAHRVEVTHPVEALVLQFKVTVTPARAQHHGTPVGPTGLGQRHIDAARARAEHNLLAHRRRRLGFQTQARHHGQGQQQ